MLVGMDWTRLHGAMSGKHTGRQSTVPNGVRPRTRILYSPDFELSVRPGPCLFSSEMVCVGEGVRRLDCARRVRNRQSRPTSHRPRRQQSKVHPLAPFFHLPFPPPLLNVSPITLSCQTALVYWPPQLASHFPSQPLPHTTPHPPAL